MAEPRRVFHFVFGLREQVEPFHLLHYLCLASCLAVNRPDAVRFHYRNEPHGPWWERIRDRIELVPIRGEVAYDRARYGHTREGLLIEKLGLAYAHEADFIRLDALVEEGGAYADMDTLFVRPYRDEWFRLPFAIGEENASRRPDALLEPSLCNAVMFAQPGARFASAWRSRMADLFDGSWDAHSCRAAARLWAEDPASITVLPSAYFYRYAATRAGLRTLLEESDGDRPDLYSIHLWAHLWWSERRTDFSRVHAGQVDERWVRESNATLARLARPFLPAD